jgi:hypothetical protein
LKRKEWNKRFILGFTPKSVRSNRKAIATVANKPFDKEWSLNIPHITKATSNQTSRGKIHKILKVNSKRIGYIIESGDEVPGYNVQNGVFSYLVELRRYND